MVGLRCIEGGTHPDDCLAQRVSPQMDSTLLHFARAYVAAFDHLCLHSHRKQVMTE